MNQNKYIWIHALLQTEKEPAVKGMQKWEKFVLARFVDDADDDDDVLSAFKNKSQPTIICYWDAYGDDEL